VLFIQIYDINGNRKEPLQYKWLCVLIKSKFKAFIKIIDNMAVALKFDKKRSPITGDLFIIYVGK